MQLERALKDKNSSRRHTTGANVQFCTLITVFIHPFTDGQMIAKKLSIQVKKETNTIRALLVEYSVCQSSTSSGVLDTLSLQVALDPQNICLKLQSIGNGSTVAIGEKREIIDAYLAFCRSKEETAMLIEEASNTCVFYQEKLSVIQRQLKALSSYDDSFGRGAKALLYNLLEQTSHHFECSKYAEDQMKIQVQQQTTDSSYCSSDDCSSESSDNSGDEFEM